MSWTQVHVTGLAQTVEPANEDLEQLLAERFHLASDNKINQNLLLHWAGPGSTVFKRDTKTGASRGYAFLSFLSLESAEIIVQRINDYENDTTTSAESSLPSPLQAQLSKPKTKGSKKKNANYDNTAADVSDIRLRRQRGAPVRKHPVIISSDRKKTGLGNKTR